MYFPEQDIRYTMLLLSRSRFEYKQQDLNYTAQGIIFNILWQTIMEKNKKKNMYNWITLLYRRTQHCNQLYFNKIEKKFKYILEIYYNKTLNSSYFFAFIAILIKELQWSHEVEFNNY